MTDPRFRRRGIDSGATGGNESLGFRFRPDLRALRESTDDGNRVNVRIVDPTNGKHYSFSETEYFLCEAANGRDSLQTIVQRYEAKFGQPLPLREVRSFYRRLRIFGLTEPVAGAADEPNAPGQRTLADRLGRSPAQPAGSAGVISDDGEDDVGDDSDIRTAGAARGAARGHGGGRLLNALSSQDEDASKLLRALMQARAAQHMPGQREEQAENRLLTLWLMQPAWLYRLLYILFFPVKYLTWMVWPGLVFAGLTIFHRWNDFGAAVLGAMASLSKLSEILLSLFLVTFVARLAQGTVVMRLTGMAPRIGINLIFGLIPHFVVGLRGTETLSKRDHLLVYATPMLMRLSGFIIGTLVWAFFRHTHEGISHVALLIGQASLTHFLITALPLVLGDGYHWLAIKLDEPRLRGKAIGAIHAWLNGRKPNIRDGKLSATTVGLFAGGIVLAVAGLSLQFLVVVGSSLEAQFGGTGAVLFLGLVASNIAWWVALYRRTGDALQRGPARDIPAADAGGTAAFSFLREPRPTPPSEEEDTAATPGERAYTRARLFWACLLIAALCVAFLPYDYEAGGPFTVLPAEKQTVAVRTDGEVIGIFVREGEWVEAGQVVAQLSAWDEERDLAVAEAALEKAQANLADLEARPKKEEVVLAERQVDSARATVDFSRAQAERAEYLYKMGSGSLQSMQQAKTTLEQDIANLNVAIANLDLVKSGATPAEIEAARAEVRRLQHEVAYYRDQLERTRVRAPVAGRVITPNVELLSGKFLTNGQPFLDLEDSRVATVEIEVPETDIEQVAIGRAVRIKPWGYSDRMIVGEVSAIAPALETRDLGEVLRVKAAIPNEHGELKSGMTGYAKIAGNEMPVWRAYLSLFVRFFRVEVWSWIP
jgi:multidrug resistance efflux pump